MSQRHNLKHPPNLFPGELAGAVQERPRRLSETLAATIKLQKKTLTPFRVSRARGAQEDDLLLDLG